MAHFCGLNYDELKSVVALSCVFDEGLNIRQGLELNSNLVQRMEKGAAATFSGETYRSRDGSVRVRLQDGSGWGSILSMEGTAFLSAPAGPAVESSTDSETVTFVTLRVKTHRFLASYLAVLRKLGFTASQETVHLPAVLTFQHAGLPRDNIVAAFEPLVQGHLANFYGFPKPERNHSEEWWRYELWMEYKKEIAIWAD